MQYCYVLKQSHTHTTRHTKYSTVQYSTVQLHHTFLFKKNAQRRDGQQSQVHCKLFDHTSHDTCESKNAQASNASMYSQYSVRRLLSLKVLQLLLYCTFRSIVPFVALLGNQRMYDKHNLITVICFIPTRLLRINLQYQLSTVL